MENISTLEYKKSITDHGKSGKSISGHFVCVLDLAETDLIFPMTDLTVLCFVLAARKVLITHQRFCHC